MSAENSPVNVVPAAVVEPRSDQENERPERMRDWLIRIINSGRFPGLEWLDKDKTIFKVPWIHAKKRGYNKERDAALFREWAIHSGKYRDESDPTVWKINFRCAINGLKDIIEIKDMQTEDCRVYKVLPSRKSQRRNPRHRKRSEPYPTNPYGLGYTHASTSGYGMMHEGSMTCGPASSLWMSASGPASDLTSYTHAAAQSLYAQCAAPPAPSAPSMKLEYRPYSTSVMSASCEVVHAQAAAVAAYPTAACVPSSAVTLVSMPADSLTCESSIYDHHPQVSLPSISTLCEPISSTSSNTSNPIRRQDSPDSGYCQNSPSEQQTFTSTATSGCIPYSGALSPTCSVPGTTKDESSEEEQDIKELVDVLECSQLSPSSVSSPHPHGLSIWVLYGSITVYKEDIICNNGCRISNGCQYSPVPEQDFERLFGPPNAHQVTLNPMHPDPIFKDIHDAMSRGLILEMVDGDIYATALCRTMVYCGTSSCEQSYLLQKEQKTKVFDYTNYFRPALEQYAIAQGRPPSPLVIFGLGQSWGPSKHAVQNLVSIVVTHITAQRELDMVVPLSPPHAIPREFLSEVPDSIEIENASVHDLEAEAILNQFSS